MNLPGKVNGLPLQQSNDAILREYIEIFWRRKWWIALPLVLGLVGGYLWYMSRPTFYQSSTLILVEPQRVPASYVNSTVSGTVDDRLRTISQQIMSRTNLSKIVRDYNLYKAEDAAQKQSDDWWESTKHEVKKLLITYGLWAATTPLASSSAANRDEISEGTVERMRRDIDIKVTGKEAFSVTYKSQDPQTAMRVANTLALLFIEENLKVRERQAEGTSEFLESQVAEIEKELQKQERALRQFQEQHRGALPAQLDTNLRTLDRLQQELTSINDVIGKTEMVQLAEQKRAEEERKMLQEILSIANTAPTPTALPVRSSQTRLEALKQELVKLQATFNESYPDVVALKKQIEEFSQSESQAPDAQVTPGLQALGGSGEIAAAPTGSVAKTSAAGTTKPLATKDIGLMRTSQMQEKAIAAAVAAANEAGRELGVLRARRDKVIEQMRQLEKFVAATPANEEKLLELTRDHSTALNSYHALLEKRLNAKVSENLEKKQKGEQFRILDPANFPTTPIRPNLPGSVGMGGALGAGLGAGIVLLLHFFNPVIRKSEDIFAAFGIPLLATIPRYDEALSKKHNLIVLQDPESFVAEQFRLLYTKIHDLQKERGQKIFAMTSALQSEGKTVTALNLAVVMAKDFGRKTLVIEGDFRRPTIPLYLKVDLEEGLVDVLSSKVNVHDTMVPVANTLVPFASENLTVLPAVRRTQNSSSLLSSPRMRDLFELLREQYDFILIDAPPILPLSDMNIFEEVVDGILLVVRAERTPRGAITKAIQTLGTSKLLGIVLNDVGTTLASYYQYGYKYRYKYTAEKN